MLVCSNIFVSNHFPASPRYRNNRLIHHFRLLFHLSSSFSRYSDDKRVLRFYTNEHRFQQDSWFCEVLSHLVSIEQPDGE